MTISVFCVPCLLCYVKFNGSFFYDGNVCVTVDHSFRFPFELMNCLYRKHWNKNTVVLTCYVYYIIYTVIIYRIFNSQCNGSPVSG